jgi:gamma-glutamyl phosphate reductase
MLENSSESTKSFDSSAAVLSVVMKHEDCEKAAVERIATKHQKIRKLVRMTQLSMTE